MASNIETPKNIYKNHRKWIIKKSVNGQMRYFKSFDTLEEAISYKNLLIKNNWKDPSISNNEEKYKLEQKEYYARVSLDSTRRWYRIRHNKYGILDRTKDIYTALFYRDLYSQSDLKKKDIPLIADCDLVNGNPYLENGLKYKLPERLILNKTPQKRGKGAIRKKSVSSYSVYQGKTHFCSCRTYEQAWYVRRELNKIGWDKKELDRILDEYPIFYTKLLQFYIYLSKDKKDGKWLLTIPKNKSDDGLLQHIKYSNIEDALFERDFLMKYDWNYDLLVTNIDDTNNPYYNMELPPYPERKIRNISPRVNHDDDLLRLRDIILENPKITVNDLANSINITSNTLRNWFKQYNTNSKEFRKVVLEGKNPVEVFQQAELIFTPDLSKSLPSNYKGYVHYSPQRKTPYIIGKNDVYYGAYPTRELADRVVKELVKVNWDKSKLKNIQKRLKTHYLNVNDSTYIHRTHKNSGSWRVRKKINGRYKSFGAYETKELAIIARDILVDRDFECDDLDKLKKVAKKRLGE